MAWLAAAAACVLASTIEDARAVYAQGDFEKSLAVARHIAGAESDGRTRVEALKLVAACELELGRPEAARTALADLFRLSAGEQFDPAFFVPELIALAEEERRKLRDGKPKAPSLAPHVAVAPASAPYRKRAWVPAATGAVLASFGGLALAQSDAHLRTLRDGGDLGGLTAHEYAGRGAAYRQAGAALLAAGISALAVAGALYLWPATSSGQEGTR